LNFTAVKALLEGSHFAMDFVIAGENVSFVFQTVGDEGAKILEMFCEGEVGRLHCLE
jgi:hypothetical protein